jgi:Tfp pilus assembly protein PilO
VSRIVKVLLPVGVIAAALAAYWYLALAPKRDEVAKLDTQVVQAQTAVQTAQSTANNYESTRKAYRQNYATVVRLGKAVPADDDVRSLMVQLDSSAKRSHIDFSNIALTDVGSSQGASADPAQASTFVTQPFTFAFKGSFFRLSDFFSHLDRFVQVDGDAIDVTGRLLRIESFTLTPQASSNTLQAQIGATSYSLPETQGLTGGATAQGPAGATATAPGTTPATGSTPPTTTATAGVTG